MDFYKLPVHLKYRKQLLSISFFLLLFVLLHFLLSGWRCAVQKGVAKIFIMPPFGLVLEGAGGSGNVKTLIKNR